MKKLILPIGLFFLAVATMFFPILGLACDYSKHHYEIRCVDGKSVSVEWDDQYGNGPDHTSGTDDDVFEGSTEPVITDLNQDCGQTRTQHECLEGTTTLHTWKEESLDGGSTWQKIEGSDVSTLNSLDCGYVPPVVSQPKTGQWICVQVCHQSPPMDRECLIPIAANQILSSDVEMVFIPGHNAVIRVDGGVNVANFTTKAGEEIKMVFTPNVCYGDCGAVRTTWWANGCYIEKSSWHPEGMQSGQMTISGTDPTNAGNPCISQWIYVEVEVAPPNE